MHVATRARVPVITIAAAIMVAEPADAAIVLSRAVVDIAANADVAQDIEIANDDKDVAYVVVEPSEIVSPGQAEERRVAIVDPGVGGLLVSPQRLILQPGERKLIRLAAIAPRGPRDRIYRVTVKPVAGPVTAQVSALKLLVGYDVLVIYRPTSPSADVVGERSDTALTLRNPGNTSVELFDGRQCEPAVPTACKNLPAKRLYAGQSWQQPLNGRGPVTYRVAIGTSSTQKHF